MNKDTQQDLSQKLEQFWDGRAKLGELAGTNDFMLTEIEQKFILEIIPECSHVLDIGCGNSMSLIKLALEKRCSGVGIDFSYEMVKQSQQFINDRKLNDRLTIHHCGVPPVPTEYGSFDVVMSNRALINLETSELQKQAIQSIPNVLRPGGMYLMIECSLDGGDLTNYMRNKIGLGNIDPPWHNLFFKEKYVESWQTDNFKIEQMLHISSTYHFLSRVVYAKLAELNNQEMKYDSEINKIALMLPAQIGEFGPVKAWIWRKSLN